MKLLSAVPNAILPSSLQMSGIHPKISLLPMLSQINTIASNVKVTILILRLASTMSSGFLLLF